MATWIAKTSDSTRHEVESSRFKFQRNDGTWWWRAETLCGLNVVGASGETILPIDCRNCQRVHARHMKETKS